MRTIAGKRFGMLGVLMASAALAGVVTPAMAGDKYGRDYQRGRHAQYDPYYAGTLRIGDRRFDLRTDTSVREEIAYRFMKLGYNAWSEYDKVYVLVGHHYRPRVRWLSGTHNVSTWYEGDCLVIKIIPPEYGHRDHHARAPYRPSWGNGWNVRRGPWQSGSRRGRRQYTRASIGRAW